MERRWLGLALLLASAACRTGAPALAELSPAQAPLAARFDADLGHPRLVLSVSPT